MLGINYSVTPTPGPNYAIDQVPGNLSPRALLLVVAVQLPVVRVDTFCGQRPSVCSHIPFAQLRTEQVAMTGGEPVASWAPQFLSATPHAVLRHGLGIWIQ